MLALQAISLAARNQAKNAQRPVEGIKLEIISNFLMGHMEFFQGDRRP